jgi:hypothetical protein
MRNECKRAVSARPDPGLATGSVLESNPTPAPPAVYPGYFAGVPAAVTYFTGCYAWYNDLHPLTTLAMLTPNQVYTARRAEILTAGQAREPPQH